MATVTAYATSISQVDTSGADGAWSQLSGTLEDAWGAASDGINNYAFADIDVAGVGSSATTRLTFTGFDSALSAIPSGSTINSILASLYLMRSALGDNIFIPASTGAGAGTHQMRFYNPTSGGANQTTYAGSQNCRWNQITNLSTSYALVSRLFNAASDSGGTSSRFGTFFSSLARLKTGLVCAVGCYDEDTLFDLTTVSGYKFSLTVDYTAPSTWGGRISDIRRRSGTFRRRRMK